MGTGQLIRIMNPGQGKSCWLERYLRTARKSLVIEGRVHFNLFTAISFDDDGGDVVVLGVALHKHPSGVVDTICDIRR